MVNKSKINVLVDGVGGDVGQGIIKCLKDSEINVNIHSGCISPQSGWLYQTKEGCMFPPVDADNFENFIINYINDNNIDVYFPTIDQAIYKISRLRSNIEEKTKCIVFVDSPEKIDICEDKYKTVQFLEKNNFHFPKSCELISLADVNAFVKHNGFPLILKPKSGNGSKGVLIINETDELLTSIGDTSLMLQEFLDIEYEITSGIYLGDDSEVKGIYVLKRTLKNGSTFHAERLVDSRLNEQLISIAKSMDMKYINIQATYKDNDLKPFEFNGRMSGTTGAMRRVFNAPEIFIKERLLGETVTPSMSDEIFFFTRYNEELFFTKEEVESVRKRSIKYD